MINSRKIADLHPKVQKLAVALREECAKAGIDIIFTSTYRDNEAQDELYKIGRTIPGANKSQRLPMGRIVTKAKAGQSYHNHRVAFDVVPIVSGKAIWNDNLIWKKIGEIGQSLGLTWAGGWINFKELPHFQYTEGLKWQDFRAGKNLS